jgi:hypothetical protein
MHHPHAAAPEFGFQLVACIEECTDGFRHFITIL